jgi:hypothetical protein
MTLILTVANDQRVFQVSDRRITARHANGATTIPQDDECKSIYVRCNDAHFALSYTGLARMGSMRMDQWLAKEIAGSNHSCDEVLNFIGTHIVQETKRETVRVCGLQSNLPTTFVWAGIRQMEVKGAQGSLVPCEATFVGHQCTWPSQCKAITHSRAHVSIDGMTEAVPPSLLKRIQTLTRSALFNKRSIDIATAELVSEIRIAAADTRFGNTIGANCSSIVLTKDINCIHVNHHSEADSSRAYPPTLVIGGTILRTLAESDDGSPLASGRLDIRFNQ